MNTDARIDGSPVAESLFELVNSAEEFSERLSVKTIDDYSKKIGVIERAILQSGEKLAPLSLANHIRKISQQGNFAQSTLRTKKAAAIFWLAEDMKTRLALGEDIQNHENAYQQIRRTSTKQAPLSTPNTSSTKLKFFSQGALEALEQYVEDHPSSINAALALSFVRANLLVGLRPVEWLDAAFFTYLHRSDTAKGITYLKSKDNTTATIASTPALLVTNAKHSHGRANGEFRELLLTGINDKELADLIHFKDLVNRTIQKIPTDAKEEDKEKAIKDFFKGIQQSLRTALKKAGFKKGVSPTLYSTRHQAVADAKASGKLPKEIAAFFGHVSTKTATHHYGKKISSWRNFVFTASQESINAVHVKNMKIDGLSPSKETVEAAKTWISDTQPGKH